MPRQATKSTVRITRASLYVQSVSRVESKINNFGRHPHGIWSSRFIVSRHFFGTLACLLSFIKHPNTATLQHLTVLGSLGYEPCGLVTVYVTSILVVSPPGLSAHFSLILHVIYLSSVLHTLSSSPLYLVDFICPMSTNKRLREGTHPTKKQAVFELGDEPSVDDAPGLFRTSVRFLFRLSNGSFWCISTH